MTACVPNQGPPQIAVGFSGGPDSLALTLLLRDWVAARGGRLVALTVDHGLRPSAAAEAAAAADLARRLGVAHHILTHHPADPGKSSQAAAREARFRLLLDACDRLGLPLLALAHHRQDQGETYLLRADSGSGPHGLAAMPLDRDLGGVRVIRPLLRTDREVLARLCADAGLSPIQDPSNRDRRFARVRLRQDVPAAAIAAAADAARAAGLRRHADETAAIALLDQGCEITPLGFAWLRQTVWAAAPAAIAGLALGWLLRCLGGGQHAPAPHRSAALLADGLTKPATLGRCRLVPWRDGLTLLCREARGLPPARPLEPLSIDLAQIRIQAPQAARSARRTVMADPWDRRFHIDWAGEVPAKDVDVRPLGTRGCHGLADVLAAVPPPARASLPALWRGDSLVALPLLGHGDPALLAACRMRFAPKTPLPTRPFSVA